MTIMDDARQALGSVISTGWKTLNGQLTRGRAKAGELRDGRRRRALIVDLGELYFAQQSGSDDPQTEADLDAVLAELQHLEAAAEQRDAGAECADAAAPAPPAAAQAGANGALSDQLSSV